MTSARRLTIVVGAALLAAACGSGAPAEPPPAAAGGELDGTITVLAAASLTDVFTELGAALEARHPEVTVRLNPGASSALREQVLAGAPADVFASADPGNVAAVVEAGEARRAVPFATNEIQLAVPRGNPAGVRTVADLADEDLLLGLCAPEVPCGALARQALERAGVPARPDTEEPDARALLAKVRAGELDAGLVYRTDVRSTGGEVEGIDLPVEARAATTYPVVVLERTDERDVAEAFVELLLSADGQAVLARAGFGPP